MPPLYSVITCSIDGAKFNLYKAMLASMFTQPYELIHIDDAASLCEGYNRGAARANAEYLVFCHDDIAILNAGFAERLAERLKSFDLVGVSGTSRLVNGKWVSAGFPYLHGQICHGDSNQAEVAHLIYGSGQDPVVVEGIQALDGVFFACKAEVWRRLGFDQAVFDGFHLYDLDFTFRAFLAGYSLAVDYGLHLQHFSSGNFDRTWNRYKYLFQKKHKARLDKLNDQSLPFFISNKMENLSCCATEMLSTQAQTPVSLDPNEQRPAFRKLTPDQLGSLSKPCAFWYLPGEVVEKISLEKLILASRVGAMVEFLGSMEQKDRLDLHLKALSTTWQVAQLMVVVAGRMIPEAHQLYRIVRAIRT